MQQLRSVFSCAAVASGLLGALLVDAPANAAVYDFSFWAGVYGTITTGAAAADPGYQLVTGLTFDLLSGETSQGSDFSFMNQVASELETTAAYNPTTQAFINHYEGGDFDDLGNFSLPAPVEITPGAFSLGSSGLSGSVVLSSGLSGRFVLVLFQTKQASPHFIQLAKTHYAATPVAGCINACS